MRRSQALATLSTDQKAGVRVPPSALTFPQARALSGVITGPSEHEAGPGFVTYCHTGLKTLPSASLMTARSSSCGAPR
jgi:hypothetical protein